MGTARSRLAAGVALLALLLVLALAIASKGTGSARATTTVPEAEPPAPPDDDLARLAAGLRNPDIDVRVDAAVELRGLGEHAVPVFLGLLRDGDRALAVRSLGRMGAAAATAVPALIDLLEAEPALRPLVVEALAAIGNREAVGPLLPLLKEPDLVVTTLRAIAKLRPDTPEAALAIAAVLDPVSESDANGLALDALKAMGPDAAPALPKLLAAFANRDLLAPAIEAIGAMGPKAHPAIPALKGVIVEEERRKAKELEETLESAELVSPGDSFGPYPEYEAERALTAIGEAAIPAVLALLAHELEGVRGTGRDILAGMGDPALPHVVASAANADPHVREAAAGAMKKLAKGQPELLDVLGRLARDDDPEVRRAALESLGSYGQAAAPFVAVALEETDNETLEVALASFARVTPRDPETVARLVHLLDNDESVIRWRAATALAAMGDAAAAGIPALVSRLGDESEYMQDSAGEALATLGERAVPSLLAGLDLAPACAQRHTLALLAAREPFTEEMRAACHRMLLSAHAAVRVEAAAALAAHGDEGDAILPVLLAGLGSRRHDTRSSAAAGIGAMGVRAAAALPDLLRAAVREGERESNRLLLGDVLAAVGRRHPEALAAAMSDESRSLRFDAASALGKIGEPAVPALAGVLGGGSREARIDAAGILQRLAAKSEAARAALLAARSLPDPEVRLAVLAAVWNATLDAHAVVPGFLDLTRSAPAAGRATAAYYLSLIGPRAAFAIKEIRAAHDAATDEAVRSDLAKTIDAIETR